MDINKLKKEIHNQAVKNGFWEDSESILEQVTTGDREAVKSLIVAQKIALIHSEVSEALEADRKGKRANIGMYYGDALDDDKAAFLNRIKDTVEDELADTVIRIMDLCEWMNIDLEWHIQKKMEYNSMRPYKHNKSY